MKSLGGDSGLFLDLDCEHRAKAAIRRRLTHMGPSSLCDRLAGSCLGEVSGEECARLFFRVLSRRLVVFEPVAEMADARSQLSDIEIMMDSRITGQSNRRAIRPGMRDHFTTRLHRARFIRLANQDQGRRSHAWCRDDAVGIIDDCGAKPFCEILRSHVSLDNSERRFAAQGLAENGHPGRIDEIQLRQVAQRCVGIERLISAPDPTTLGIAARAEAVDGKHHIPPGTQSIGDPGEMPSHANATVQYNNRRERSAAVGTAFVEFCRQTGIRPRQIAEESWRVFRKVRKFDQGAGRGGAGAEQ
jgi:hypothetical protein